MSFWWCNLVTDIVNDLIASTSSCKENPIIVMVEIIVFTIFFLHCHC